MRLHNYTLKYITFILLGIVALWAILFYAFILDEVYDNIDDSLKNSKNKIIQESYRKPEILNIREFGINNFRFIPVQSSEYSDKTQIQTISEYLDYDGEDEPVRMLSFYFIYNQNKAYKVEIKTSILEEDDLLIDLGIALIVLYFLLIISVFFVNYLVLKKAWKSFYLLLDKLKKYTLGSQENFINSATTIKEFKNLEYEISTMIGRNEELFIQQKLFISNASHELQTPLAIILNKLEFLLQNQELNSDVLEQIVSIQSNLNRLVHLNKTLLTLTKIENDQFLDKKSINFNDLILNTAEQFSDLIEFKQISYKINQINTFIFEMNEHLASILVNNMFKNAINHNYKKGKIEIEIDSNYFNFKNTSKTTMLDSTKIFDRFYKNSTNPNSIGLGLSLVKTIIQDNYPLKIEYFFKETHDFRISK